MLNVGTSKDDINYWTNKQFFKIGSISLSNCQTNCFSSALLVLSRELTVAGFFCTHDKISFSWWKVCYIYIQICEIHLYIKADFYIAKRNNLLFFFSFCSCLYSGGCVI